MSEEDDPITTNAMLRAQDLSRIAELEGLLRRCLTPYAQPGREALQADIEAALAKGKK